MESLEIYKLTPERLDDYLYFFENVAHTDNKEWDRCYCVNYASTDNVDLGIEFFDADERRKYAIQYVKEGIIKGYLAYYKGKIIGWCNANDRNECVNCMGWQTFISKKTDKVTERVKSIFCFTVAPDMRGKHVATALLKRVIEDAEKEGYKYLEAYPNKGETDMYYNFVGPIGLYKKFGFEILGETDKRMIVRKKLNLGAL